MAVQEMNQRNTKGSQFAFWLAAGLAAVLSLAAALVGLRGGSSESVAVTQTALNEALIRNQRIEFFEMRAAADVLDFVSLNILAREYLQRARETGDVADYRKAEVAAVRSNEILPVENYSGLYFLASVRLVQHDYDAARELSQRAIELKPSEASAYGALGDAQLGLGKYTEAGATYGKMVELSPGLSSLSRLANHAFVTGDHLNSADFWRQATTSSQRVPAENLAWAHTQRGNLYLSRGDTSLAEPEFKQALEIYPDYILALAGMGGLRSAQGRWDDSIAFYNRAVDKQPQPQYVAALGDAYAHAGRFADAEAQYELVEAIDRIYQANGINTDLQISLFYAEHDRDPDRALALAEAAYAEAPNVYAADALAWALYRKGRFSEASLRSQEALRLGTPEASFAYHGAAIRYALNDIEGARTSLQSALTINPRYLSLRTDGAVRLAADLGVRR